MTAVEEELAEAEAKNRLYELLADRTRCACVKCVLKLRFRDDPHAAALPCLHSWAQCLDVCPHWTIIGCRREHQEIDLIVRDKQLTKRNCSDDASALYDHYTTTRAAKEDAERELGKIKQQVEQQRRDWQLKIRDRRREV